MEKHLPSVKVLFDHARDLETPIQRRAYLDEACAGAPELRKKVDALLKAHGEAGSFLEQPAVVKAETMDVESDVSHIAEGPGSRIGPYKLLQRIGEGGMGAVYMAEQEEPVRRRVALKIIKPGMDSAQVIARFEAERQALALMDHQNIARVHDAGATATGRPYFVMELVHGVPITTYCDENRLTPRERLELVVPVCQAVQHAHQKGIIHRDLKPTNILVTLYDGQPVPKVIDFGVAKATEQKLTERTMFTHYGTIVGTVEYMAPEQAEMSALGVDTRSDIYSLGVLLYELLTGSTPLEGKMLREAAFTDMLRLIKEEEPPRPSLRLTSSAEALATISQKRGTDPAKLTKLVRGELDWIVMRCLEKDRTRRYETANALARDIQRHLADEPVEACPPSAGYRVRKLARKYRTPLRAAAAFALLLIAGVVVSAWLAVRAGQAEVAAREEKENTRAALDFIENEVLAQASPEYEPARDLTLRTLLDRVSDRMDRLAEKPPLVEASLRRTVGRIYTQLSEFSRAHRHLERAYDLHRRSLGDRHVDTLRSRLALAVHFWLTGDYEKVEPLAVEGLELVRETLGEEDRLAFGFLRLLARTYSFQGQSLKAVALLELAIGPCRRVLGENDLETLGLMNDLAISSARHDPSRAEPLLLHVFKRRSNLLGEKNHSTLVTRSRLAALYGSLGQYARQEELSQKAWEIRQEVLGEDDPHTLSAMASLARAYVSQQKFDKAETLFRRLLEASREARFWENPFPPLGMRSLASAYQRQGDWARAEQLYRALVEKALPNRGGYLLRRDRLLIGLGESLLRQGKHVEAAPPLLECLELRKREMSDTRCRFEAMSLLGRSLAGQGKLAEATPLLVQGYDGMKQRESEVLAEDPDEDDRKLSLAEPGGWIVELYQGWGKKDEAAQWRTTIEEAKVLEQKP